jgi:hypothetical protein
MRKHPDLDNIGMLTHLRSPWSGILSRKAEMLTHKQLVEKILDDPETKAAYERAAVEFKSLDDKLRAGNDTIARSQKLPPTDIDGKSKPT